MKKIMLTTGLLCAILSVCAQDMSTVIYRNDANPQAIKVDNIESIEVMETAQVDATYYATSHWAGKKVGFLGDSITEFAEYVNAYAALTGCEVLNYGISATHIAKIDASTQNAFETRASKIDRSCDLVIVFGGTNDFGHTTTAEFGEFSDGTKTGRWTFYAGLHRMMKQLRTRFKDIPVVIMTPIHHGTKIDCPEYIINSDGTLVEGTNPTTGKTFKQYVDAIKEVAAYYSLPVLDAYSYSSLSPMVDAGNTYFRDGLHLSEKGGQRLAKWMYPQLEQIAEQW